ncbi:MAG: DUF1697 domain-containing protein [Mycobacteriales bacterium]
MPTWVALLRAVNLVSHNRVSMPKLREALAGSGFGTVRTYVNSGNVVLDSPLRSPAKVAAAIHDVIVEHFGVDTPVIVRTGRQLAEVLAWNPFPAAVDRQPKLVAVIHLAAEPAPAAVEEVLAADVSPDEIAVRGSEVVVAWAKGTGNPKTDRVLRRIGVEGTARNWRTLTALVEMTSSR